MTKKNTAVGYDWTDVRKELFTPEEIAESNLRVALISEFIKDRQELGITQKKLEELSGVKQPIIARMETGATSPQLDTILKVTRTTRKNPESCSTRRKNHLKQKEPQDFFS